MKAVQLRNAISGILKGNDIQAPLRHKVLDKIMDAIEDHNRNHGNYEEDDPDTETDVRDHVGRKSDNTDDEDI